MEKTKSELRLDREFRRLYNEINYNDLDYDPDKLLITNDQISTIEYETNDFEHEESESAVNDDRSDLEKMLCPSNFNELTLEDITNRISQFTDCQKKAYNYIKDNISCQCLMFLTGLGGTGKTFFLQTISSFFSNKSILNFVIQILT